jgi:hypothetical protein
VSFTSRLEAEHIEALQDLFFFNEKQGRYRDGIINSIESYGEPFFRVEDGLIRVHTAKLGRIQSIFAVAEDAAGSRSPVGVAVFTRTSPDTFSLLHISVDAPFSVDGVYSKELVALKLFQRTMDAARSIRGIRRVTVHYGPVAFSEFPLRR